MEFKINHIYGNQEDFDLQIVKLTLNNDLSEAELKETQKEIIKEEHEIFENFIQSEKFKDNKTEVITKLLYGKAGNEIKNFAIENEIDLLIIHSPYKKLTLLDRIFQHDIEYLLEDLPCDILMVHE